MWVMSINASVTPKSDCHTIQKSAPIMLPLKLELDGSDFEIRHFRIHTAQLILQC